MAIPNQRPPYKRRKQTGTHRRKGEGTTKTLMAEFNALEDGYLPRPAGIGITAVETIPNDTKVVWYKHIGGTDITFCNHKLRSESQARVAICTFYFRPADNPLIGVAMNTHTSKFTVPQESIWAMIPHARDAAIDIWRHFLKVNTRRKYPPERIIAVMSFGTPVLLFDGNTVPSEQRRIIKSAFENPKQAMASDWEWFWDHRLPDARRGGLEYIDLEPMSMTHGSPVNWLNLPLRAHVIAMMTAWYHVTNRREPDISPIHLAEYDHKFEQ